MFTDEQIEIINTLARRVARGSYQRAILSGRQRVSGADLRGRASNWGMRYARSRSAVIGRFARALRWEFDGRYAVGIETIERRNELVIRDECDLSRWVRLASIVD